MLHETSTEELSVMTPFFFFVFLNLLWGEYSIFSLILQQLQHFPTPPPDSDCPWMRKLRAYWLSWWMETFLSWKWNALWKIAFHKKHANNPTTVSSFLLQRATWLHSHILVFKCIYSEASNNQVESRSIKPFIILKTWASELLRTFSSLHSER